MKQLLCGTVAICLYLAAASPARCGTMYWSDFHGGDIRRANLDGTGQTILVTGQSNPLGPELDLAGGWMYWGLTGGSIIRRAHLDGSAQSDVVTGLSGPGVPALDLAGGRMYWDNSDGDSVQSANLDGTAQSTLATRQSIPHSVRLDVAGGHVYWPESGGGRIRRVNLDGTGLTTLVTGLAQPGLLDLDIAGGKMYWTEQGPDEIRRANLDGSGQETLVRNQDNPSAITLDVSGGKMYWSNVSGGEIRRANLDGTEQETLFTGLPGPAFIALDFTSESAPLHTWNIDGNGNWSAVSNWTINVPNAAGVELVLGGVITSPRTVTVDRPITVGRLNFENTTAYTIAGSSNFTLDSTSGEARINVASGSHTISAPLRLMDNTTIMVTPAASNLSITGTLNASGRNLSKVGSGTLTVNNVRAAGLSVNGGTVAIAPSGTGAATSVMRSLTIAGATDAWTAKLDLANNDAVVLSSAANKAADVSRLHNQLKQGFNNGTWTGLGITSTTAASNAAGDTGLSVVDNALLGFSEFSGQPVTADSILLKYTYYGDIDQNGQVDADDLTVFASNFGRAAGATHIDGDIDFNGTVNADDLTVFANNFNKGVGNPLAAASVQAVPEPATLYLAGSAGLLLFLRKRRTRRA